eukprot:5444197-Amphidinium_carterae.1
MDDMVEQLQAYILMLKNPLDSGKEDGKGKERKHEQVETEYKSGKEEKRSSHLLKQMSMLHCQQGRRMQPHKSDTRRVSCEPVLFLELKVGVLWDAHPCQKGLLHGNGVASLITSV